MQTPNTTKLFVFLLLLTPFLSFAQTQQDRWAISLGGGVNRFLSYPAYEQTLAPLYDPAFSFAGTRYLRGGFDFRTQLSVAPQARIPMPDASRSIQPLVDMNYQLMFKFNNGVFLRESAFFAPYLLFGIGGSYAPSQPDAYVPLGGGLRFRLGQRMSLRVETVRKFSLNKQPEQLAHAIAFVYNLPSKEKNDPLPEGLEDNSPELIASMIPQDRDQDGIIDLEDNCPDEAGTVRLKGCPENNTLSNTSENVYLADASGLKDPLLELEQSLPQSQEELIDKYAPLPDQSETDEPMGNVGVLAELRMPSESTKYFVEQKPADPKPSVASQSKKPIESAIPVYPPIDEVGRIEVAEMLAPSAMQAIMAPSSPRRPEVDSPCGDFGVAQVELAPIQFPVNGYNLEGASYSTLDRIAEAMQSCPNVNLVIEGHADAVGADDKNLVLSVMRAYNVKYYLVYEHGISQQRILSKGKGETAPIADNSSLQGRDQNRRVDFRFVF